MDEKARDDEVGDTSGHSRGHEDKVDDEKSESRNDRYEGIAEQEGYGEKYRGKGDTIGVAHRNVSQKVYEAVGFGLEARNNTRIHQRDKHKVEAASKRYREIIDEGFGGKDLYAAFAAKKRGLSHTAALYERSIRAGDGIQFSHTVEGQIGGQLRAGFMLTDLYEDTDREGFLHDYNIPQYLATLSLKP